MTKLSDPEVNTPINLPTTQEQDEVRLAQLGYKQELKRNWSLLHNFGVSFSIIVSILLDGRPLSVQTATSILYAFATSIQFDSTLPSQTSD